MKTRLGTKLLLSFAGCSWCALAPSGEARAQTPSDLSDFDGPAVVERALTKDAKFQTACTEAKFYIANQADLRDCYGNESAWGDLVAQSHEYSKAACDSAQPEPADVTQAKAALDAKMATLALATNAVNSLKKKVRDFKAAEDEWRASKEAGATQHTIDARQAREGAEAELGEATKSLSKAQSEVTEAETSASKLKTDRLNKAFAEFTTAVTNAEKRSRSEADFETLLRNTPRRAVCQRLYKAELAAFAADHAPSNAARTNTAEAIQTASADHATDVLRKALAVASAATTTTSTVENPGSPDRVSYAILTALGADSKTTGTQAVLTLNLSSLFWPSDQERLKQDAWKRNVFVRGAFPLTTTNRVAETGAGASSAGDAAEISRFSVVLGGSLLDDTDTRLPTNQDCYEQVLAYVPFPQNSDIAAARSDERKRYYDVCARISANKNRLAWRAGIGFYTPNNVASPKTHPELAVLALVWGPASWIYVNLMYQGILKPDRVDSMGVGFSFAGNAGGKSSGVDGYARLGLDFLYLITYAHNDKSLDWEARIAPTFHGKILGNTIGSVGIGPRLIGSKLSSPGLMATLSLSYDADTLVQSLLTPEPRTAK